MTPIRMLEYYPVPAAGDPGLLSQAVRYWAIEGRLLVGGRIRGEADAAHLARDYGVTYVLSAESERPDVADPWPSSKSARYAFPDNGDAPPVDTIRAAIRFIDHVFVRRAHMGASGVLYVHCRLGGSRGPAYAYLALRLLGRSPEEAHDQCGRRQQGCPDLHPAYVRIIEEAITLEPYGADS